MSVRISWWIFRFYLSVFPAFAGAMQPDMDVAMVDRTMILFLINRCAILGTCPFGVSVELVGSIEWSDAAIDSVR